MKRANSFSINLLAVFISLCMVGCQPPDEQRDLHSSVPQISISQPEVSIEQSTAEPAPLSPVLPQVTSSEIPQPPEEPPEKLLLESIKSSAQQGKVINSDYAVQDLSFEQIQSELGAPDRLELGDDVEESLAYYAEQGLSFSFDTEDIIFEITSKDEKLRAVTLSTIGDYLGPADYEVFTAENEKISGYKINAQYKLIFVFDAPTNANTNPPLKEYSIFSSPSSGNEIVRPGRNW